MTNELMSLINCNEPQNGPGLLRIAGNYHHYYVTALKSPINCEPYSYFLFTMAVHKSKQHQHFH